MDKETKNKITFSIDLRLPKKLEGSDDGKKILAILNSHVTEGDDYTAPLFPCSQSIMDALHSAWRTGRIIRGFEDAEKKLTAEKKGIAYADMKTGSERVERISRIAVIANDGSKRFYRQTKKLIDQNRPRVLAIHLDVTSYALGERLYGHGKRALFLLINHKDAVVNFLYSLTK